MSVHFSSPIEGRTAPKGREPNIQGDTYGRLTLVSELEVECSTKTGRRWIVQCSCEKKTTKTVVQPAMRSGVTLSCGCLQREAITHVRPSIRIEGNVAYIPLTQGKWTVVDLEFLPIVKDHNWCYVKSRKTGYACRQSNGSMISMHNVISPSPNGFQVDHIDTNGLNNRVSNLRFATKGENKTNQGIRADNKSGFKGVYKSGSKWVACIRSNYKLIHLGVFSTPEVAHEAYCQASTIYHKEFARTY